MKGKDGGGVVWLIVCNTVTPSYQRHWESNPTRVKYLQRFCVGEERGQGKGETGELYVSIDTPPHERLSVYVIRGSGSAWPYVCVCVRAMTFVPISSSSAELGGKSWSGPVHGFSSLLFSSHLLFARILRIGFVVAKKNPNRKSNYRSTLDKAKRFKRLPRCFRY